MGIAKSYARSLDTTKLTKDTEVFVLFTDYACPACTNLDLTFRRLPTEVTRRIAIDVRHAWRSGSDNASRELALAAECARAAGVFELVDSALYHLPASQTDADWEDFATRFGIDDPADFRLCVVEERFRDHLSLDSTVTSALDLIATPSFIWDGLLYVGSPPASALEEILRQPLLESTR